jgi:DNA-binding NarL/FixJ family response regulator
MGAIKVLLVDDYPGMREAFRLLLGSHADICVVAEAANGHEAVHEALRLAPDVVIIDMSNVVARLSVQAFGRDEAAGRDPRRGGRPDLPQRTTFRIKRPWGAHLHQGIGVGRLAASRKTLFTCCQT